MMFHTNAGYILFCAYFFMFLMQVMCAPLAKAGSVPREFKPFSFLQVGEALLFTFMLFVIYNRKKLPEVDDCKVRMMECKRFKYS